MSQSTVPINSKLINSLAQIILSFTEEEREFLEEKIKPLSTSETQSKLEILQHDILLGVNQIQNGDYSEYDDLSLPSLLESIKTRGSQKLNRELPQ
jgi:hypothetical protein